MKKSRCNQGENNGTLPNLSLRIVLNPCPHLLSHLAAFTVETL
jgi:hypothetical protein